MNWSEITSSSQLSVALLKQEASFIHYFGLGFIQIKITERVRLHFYLPDLPPITEDLHDHRYPFESRILAGTLRQELWAVTSGDSFLMERETCKPGQPAKGLGLPCGAHLLMASSHAAGTSYRITPSAVHRVLPSVAITLVTRDLSGPLTETARVIRPAGSHKVCPFSKTIPEDELWDLVAKSLKSFEV